MNDSDQHTPQVDPAPYVLRRDDGAIVTLTLNRPAQLNVLSLRMIDALQAEIDAIARERTARAVVLAAAGRAFCSGHDLRQMRANPQRAFQRELFDRCSRLMLSLTRLPQPVIARVQGLATAAGCQLVATCDLAVAAASARFATSGINLGLFCSTPGVAIARTVPRKQALELLMTGDFIDADRAREIGLINAVAPDADLDAMTHGLAERLAGKSAHALALGKRVFYRQIELGLAEAYDCAAGAMAANMMDRDAGEGIDAFIAKRAPRWDQAPRQDDPA
ncbi:MAG: enoyl-CoA hydratase [Gammaproteobacteria bacterium]